MSTAARDWQSYWDRFADDKPVFRIEAEDYVARLRAALPLSPATKVLDFGCGFGYAAAILAAHVKSVAIWDASPSARQIASKAIEHRSNIEMLDLGNPEHAGLASGFDLILVHSVLQYLSEAEILSWLGRWRGWLSAGGRLVLSDLVQEESGAGGELLQYLRFAVQKQFFLSAFVSGLRRIGGYFVTRSTRPLTRMPTECLELMAGKSGLRVEWLTGNLSHRHRRKTAVLSLA